MTALVFNCAYNGLAIIRELGRHGVPVYALDDHRAVGTFSRYANFRRTPDPQTAESEFIDYLLQMGPEFDTKPVLFPTNDHWAIAISRHKEKLSGYYLPCVADFATVDLIIEKQRFYEWARSRHYPVPRSWRCIDAHLVPDDAFPLAAKPESRRTASNSLDAGKRAQVLDKMRLTVLKNRDDLMNFVYGNERMLSHFLLQEYVEGLSDCMYTVGIYANRQHEVLGVFTGRKVRGFPPDVGDCMVGQVEAIPTELVEITKQICRELKYHGIAEFEFKRDAVSGEFKLIEINPRSWSWVGITSACGVNLPWMAYADLTDIEPVSYTTSAYIDGSVKWVRILEDFPNCLYRNLCLGYPQWHMGFRQWWKSLQADRLVMAEFSLDDPLPGLFSILLAARRFIHYLIRPTS